MFVSGKAKPNQVDVLRKKLVDERVNTIVIALSSDNPRAFDPLITAEKPVIETDPTTDSKTTSKKVINGITNGKISYSYCTGCLKKKATTCVILAVLKGIHN